MSLENLIPSVWAARLLANLHKALVYAQPGVVNRDFEGEIRQKGDNVRITAMSAVSVGDYIKDAPIADPELLTDAQTVLLINRAKYFHFQIDDVDRVQQNPDAMDEAMREAAFALADEADQFVASLHTQAAAANLIGSDGDPVDDLDTPDKAYEYLVDLDGRYVVVPAWYLGLLRKDDRFVRSGTALGEKALRNGEIGMAAGMTVLESNNVPQSGSVYKIIAGYAGAITYAEQIAQVEAYRPEKRFADAVKGLHLYGAKVIRPNGIAVMSAVRPA